MGKGEKKREYREILYPAGGAIVLALLLAGFVYDPEPDYTLKDHEASLALNMRMGLLEEARADIETILSLDPDNLYALLMQAHLLLSENKTDQALSIYRKCLPLSKEYPDIRGKILETLGLLSLKVGDFSDAKLFSEKNIRTSGENYLSRFIIALSCLSLDDDRGYEENLDKALDMGVISPALKLRLDEMLDDDELLKRLYIRGFEDRDRYEHRCTETYGL